MLTPRDTPRNTRAAPQFHQDFWGQYVRAYYLGGNDKPIGNADVVFSHVVLNQMRAYMTAEALKTPVLFTDFLSNRVAAGRCELSNGLLVIAINARFKVDPEILAHTLVEEFVHAQQTLDGVDFKTQQQQFPYAERPYEQHAKHVATQVLGYEPEEFQAFIKRDEPSGPLYDRPQLESG